MESRKRINTTVRQLELLVEFMESHPDLALGKVRSLEYRALAGRLWIECSSILNAEGGFRTPKEWSRFWNDYKCRVKSKLNILRSSIAATGGGPSNAPQLSALEDRVAALIGRDAGPLTGVRRDPVIVDAEIHYQEEENIEIDLAEDSPTIDLSNVMLLPPPSPNSEVQDLVTQPNTNSQILAEPRPNPPVREHNVAVAADTNTPQIGNRSGRNRNVRSRARPTNRSNTTEQTALDEARASIARIEETRARTEELLAKALLSQREAG